MTHKSHTPTHILLKNLNSYEIVDLESSEPKLALMKIFQFIFNLNLDYERTVGYLNYIIQDINYSLNQPYMSIKKRD